MSERKLFVLGTASQVPTRQRNHGGYFLRWDEEGILIDPGEGSQRQMIDSGVSVTEITKIFITHFHGDHCLGLAGIIQRISLDKVNHTIDIYYPASGQVFYEHLKNASIFYDVAKLAEHPISSEGVIFEDSKLSVQVKALDHPVETYGYRLRERDDFTMLPEKLAANGIQGPAVHELKTKGSLLVDGKKVNLKDVSNPRPGQSFAFILDTRFCKAAVALAENTDLMVCESTYLSDRVEEAETYGHLTAAQAAEIARQAGARKLVLTHFSQRYPSVLPFIDEAKSIFPNVVAARDGESINIPKRWRCINSSK